MSFSNQSSRSFETSLFSFSNPGLLWWSVWCPGLVAGRTYEIYSIMTSPVHTFLLILSLVVVLLMSVVLGFAGFFWSLVILLIVWSIFRGIQRQKIRNIAGIDGGFMSDCCAHCLCGNCAIAQEGRQALSTYMSPGHPEPEYCCGEDVLLPIPSVSSLSCSFWDCSWLNSISRTSKLLLSSLVLETIVISLLLDSSSFILVVCLMSISLTQPILFFFLLHKYGGRDFTYPIDLLIKLFFVGFYLCPVAAMIIELVASIPLGIINTIVANGQTYDNDDEEREYAKDHLVLVLFGNLIVAFVIAATIEEFVKYYSCSTLRIFSLARSQSQYSLLLGLLCATSLGFSVQENLMYSFSSSSSSILPNGSSFENELALLALRIIFPIHLICACITFVYYTKFDVDCETKFKYFLLPSILFHGMFDFVLMALASIEFAFRIESSAFELGTFILALAITLFGAIGTYFSLKKQLTNLGVLTPVTWTAIQNDDVELR